MAKSIVSLTRLQNPDDIMYWSRQHVDELQRIFLGSGAGFIDGDSILDGTLGTDKLLATAGGIWNGNPVSYPAGQTNVVQLPNLWASSGGVANPADSTLRSPNFYGWGIVTFYAKLSPDGINQTFSMEFSGDGVAWYPRMQWTGGLPKDVNMSIMAPIGAKTWMRVTITNADTAARTIVNTPTVPLFTLGMIGQVVEPA